MKSLFVWQQVPEAFISKSRLRR